MMDKKKPKTGGSQSSRPTPKEPITGGANTVPLTPERKEFLKELEKRNAKPGMAKGGKTASCGLKNGGKAKSFAATKFGAAMMKKSADTKGRAMVKKADGGKGYAKGGKVKKMAVGGMSTMPPATTNTAPPAASNTAPPAANTAGGTVTRATPGNTLTGVPSPSAPAANTAARATTTSAAPQTASPTTTAPAPYKPVTPLQNVQNFIDRKYSSATPNLDQTPKMQRTTDAAGNVTSNKLVNTFDRNQSLRDFNSVARTFLNQGVSNKELIRAQGELRKLQMDNSSTPAQHQAAMRSIIARMNSLVPSKGAGAGAIKGPGGGLAKGGSTKAATKSGRALVKKSADTGGRAMKKYAKGGLVGGHKAANGIAKKGLTKGKQVKMNKGGACYAKGGSVRSIDGIATKGKTRCKGARK